MKIWIYAKPEKGWGLIIMPNGEGFSDPDIITLEPVWPDIWHAWEFAVAHFMIDPTPPISDKQWQNKPPELEVIQLPLF